MSVKSSSPVSQLSHIGQVGSVGQVSHIGQFFQVGRSCRSVYCTHLTLCSFSRALKAQFHWIFGPQSSFFPSRQGARAQARGPGLRYKPYVRFREP